MNQHPGSTHWCSCCKQCQKYRTSIWSCIEDSRFLTGSTRWNKMSTRWVSSSWYSSKGIECKWSKIRGNSQRHNLSTRTMSSRQNSCSRKECKHPNPNRTPSCTRYKSLFRCTKNNFRSKPGICRLTGSTPWCSSSKWKNQSKLRSCLDIGGSLKIGDSSR